MYCMCHSASFFNHSINSPILSGPAVVFLSVRVSISCSWMCYNFYIIWPPQTLIWLAHCNIQYVWIETAIYHNSHEPFITPVYCKLRLFSVCVWLLRLNTAQWLFFCRMRCSYFLFFYFSLSESRGTVCLCCHFLSVSLVRVCMFFFKKSFFKYRPAMASWHRQIFEI